MSYNILEGGIGYEGKVTLTLKSNNRVLKSQTYKNSGTSQLFSFLGRCLAGAYADEQTQNLLPTKIRLLFNESKTDTGTGATPVTTLIGMAQPPSVSDDSKTAEVKVTYNFEVPRPRIGGNFNQVALYGDGKTDTDINEFSAYYYLTGSTGNLETQDISEWSATTVLLIDWVLSISNQNTEVSNG